MPSPEHPVWPPDIEWAFFIGMVERSGGFGGAAHRRAAGIGLHDKPMHRPSIMP
jgi:hypothetical protein